MVGGWLLVGRCHVSCSKPALIVQLFLLLSVLCTVNKNYAMLVRCACALRLCAVFVRCALCLCAVFVRCALLCALLSAVRVSDAECVPGSRVVRARGRPHMYHFNHVGREDQRPATTDYMYM